MLGDDARSLRDRGQAEFDRLDAEMRTLARDATGNDDYVEVLRENDEDHPPTEEAMRQAYADWTERARQFLRDERLATLPAGEACAVVPSPVFQRPVLGVASYIAPPAFSDKLKGHFFVPYAPDGTPDAEIQERLKGNSYGSIPTTAVHEAYPGHHWHLVRRKANPSKLRPACIRRPTSPKGWALYSERVMRERGFFTDPLQELQHLNATLFRACPDHRRHVAPSRGDVVRRRPPVHDRQGGDARAGRAGRSRPLLLVADAGVVLPDRLPRDPPPCATATWRRAA